jgi:hypothetical protein
MADNVTRLGEDLPIKNYPELNKDYINYDTQLACLYSGKRLFLLSKTAKTHNSGSFPRRTEILT